VVALIGIVVYALNRRDQIWPASLLTGGLLIVIPTYYLILEGTRTTAILLFPAGIIFADFLLGGRSGLAMATINVLLYLGVGLAYQFGWIRITYTPDFLVDLCTVAIIGYGLALAAGFFTREMRQALRRAKEREVALRAADESKGQLLAELQTRDAAQRRLLETIRELGSPIIPLAQGVIALPLIGAVDSQRAQQVTVALLQGVAKHRATVAIVDITGVPVVDTAVAEALLQAARGVWLLGAEPVLTGIRAEIAQTLVGLGLDLKGITTLATLQEGLEYAIAQRQTSEREQKQEET
jgi:anti-anti-sigma regulatory factor